MVKARIEVEIIGKVQGVGFRSFVTMKANSLKINGTVKNNSNGSVSIVAEGEEKQLVKFLEEIEKSYLFARIEKVKKCFLPNMNEFSDFKVIY